jgi:hypothetical protein
MLAMGECHLGGASRETAPCMLNVAAHQPVGAQALPTGQRRVFGGEVCVRDDHRREAPDTSAGCRSALQEPSAQGVVGWTSTASGYEVGAVRR